MRQICLLLTYHPAHPRRNAPTPGYLRFASALQAGGGVQ